VLRFDGSSLEADAPHDDLVRAGHQITSYDMIQETRVVVEHTEQLGLGMPIQDVLPGLHLDVVY
jgi:hypothetical protein